MRLLRTPLTFYRNWQKFGLMDAININKLLNRKKKEVLTLGAKINGTSKNLLLRNNTTDYSIFNKIFQAKDYDFDFPFEPLTIIDAGAYAGYSSVFFALKYPNAIIFAIEPDKDNFLLLEKNTQEFKNIIKLNKALWSESTQLAFNNGDDYYKDSVSVGKIDNDFSNIVESIDINTIVKKHNIQKIDILKIDIEGAEFDVFSYNNQWIEQVRVIIIELHDYFIEGASNALFKTISKYGFSVLLRGENLICFRSYSDYLKTLKKQ